MDNSNLVAAFDHKRILPTNLTRLSIPGHKYIGIYVVRSRDRQSIFNQCLSSLQVSIDRLPKDRLKW